MPSGSSTPPNLKKLYALALGSVCFLTALVFLGALENGFVNWDDHDYVYNPRIRSLDWMHLKEMLTSLGPVYWQPVAWISHAIDYALFGTEPAGHHAVSILMHAINAAWLFLLIDHIFSKTLKTASAISRILTSALVALIFGMHPLRVESVVWAAERKDLLTAFFLFPAYLVYFKYHEATTKDQKRNYYIALVSLFLLALMSKPMAVTFPVTLLILDAYPLKRWTAWKQTFPLVLEKIPLLLLSLACGLMTIVAQKASGAVVPVSMMGTQERILNAFHSLFFYIGKTLLPLHLVPLYPFPRNLQWSNPTLALSVGAFFAVTVFAIVLWRRGIKAPGAVWASYLVMVAPVIGILQVGRQAAADRFTYLPTVGFYVLAGAGLLIWLSTSSENSSGSKRPGFLKRSLTALMACTLLVSLGLLTLKQVPVWKNSGSLWRNVIAAWPSKFPIAYHNLGMYLKEQGQLPEARQWIEAGIKIQPRFPDALNDLGRIKMEQGLLDEAEQDINRALQLNVSASTLNNLGMLYLERKLPEQAEGYFLRAVEVDPQFAEGHNNLGLIDLNRGELNPAANHFFDAIQSNYDLFQAHGNLGNVFARQGRLDEALLEYQVASALKPEIAHLDFLMGEIYRARGQFDLAQKAWEHALKKDPGHARAQQRLKELKEKN